MGVLRNDCPGAVIDSCSLCLVLAPVVRFLHSLENAGAAEELEPPPPSRKEVSDRVLPVDRSCVSSAQVHKPQFRPSGGGMQAQTTAMLDHRGQEEVCGWYMCTCAHVKCRVCGLFACAIAL